MVTMEEGTREWPRRQAGWLLWEQSRFSAPLPSSSIFRIFPNDSTKKPLRVLVTLSSLINFYTKPYLQTLASFLINSYIPSSAQGPSLFPAC